MLCSVQFGSLKGSQDLVLQLKLIFRQIIAFIMVANSSPPVLKMEGKKSTWSFWFWTPCGLVGPWRKALGLRGITYDSRLSQGYLLTAAMTGTRCHFSTLVWMFHLNVHLCEDWWLCKWVERSSCFIMLCQSNLKLQEHVNVRFCPWMNAPYQIPGRENCISVCRPRVLRVKEKGNRALKGCGRKRTDYRWTTETCEDDITPDTLD